jgi:protein ImuA
MLPVQQYPFGLIFFPPPTDTLIDTNTVQTYTISGGSEDVEDRTDRTICLEELRRRIARLETARTYGGRAVVTSGSTALDDMLPELGFRCGTLVEWLSVGEGTGAGTLALLAARETCRNGGSLVVLDRRGEFYPPAAVRLGIDPEQLLLVHAESAADHDWAMDQVLRSPAVAAVLAWPERLDGRTFRRWQLAIEQGGGLGLLLRPAVARFDPSWADVRLLVEPLPAAWLSRKRRLRISVLRCRGGTGGRSVDVELDDETYCVHLVAGERWQIAN